MADNDSRAGKRYADEAVRHFVETTHADHSAGLDAAFTAPDRHDIPAIMVGRSEGRLLDLLMRMVRAERVVEIGTLAGYSAIHIATALPATGKLWTLEYDPTHADVARENIARAGYAERVEVVVGAALDSLPTIEAHGPFDAVFIDADKENYDRYGEWAIRNLRPGGLLLGDNAYLFGRLMDDSAAAAAMRRFHEQAAQACDSVCIPTPDGLLLGIKR